MKERVTYLFQKFQDGSCSQTEFEELFHYIALAEKDKSVNELVEAVLDDNISLATMRAVKPVQGKRIYKSLLVAASIITALSLGLLFYLSFGKKEAANTVVAVEEISVPDKERYLLLSDSTKVWLNVGSTLEYPASFAGFKKREVVLKGEAFFDVKHADQIPFIIKTGEVTTEVLGTAFNVKAYPDMEKVTVSVQRGKVRVHYAEKAVAILLQGQEVSIVPTSSAVKEKKMETSEMAGWQKGRLVYDDYSIEDIVKDMERVFEVKIIVPMQELKKLRVTTSFQRSEGVEKALEILCLLTDRTFDKKDNTYFIN